MTMTDTLITTPTYKELRRFGFSLGLGLNIAGCIMFYGGRPHFIWFTCAGSMALIFAILYPPLLNFIKKILEFIISMIGRLTNAISLLLVFCLIFTPIGVLLRILGKDMLDKNIDRSSGSYWIKRKKTIFLKESYGRMG